MLKDLVIDRLTINGVDIPVSGTLPDVNEDAIVRISEMAEALEAAELPAFITTTASSAAAW